MKRIINLYSLLLLHMVDRASIGDRKARKVLASLWGLSWSTVKSNINRREFFNYGLSRFIQTNCKV